MANYYLMHHGVKGMKWGRRKDDEHTSSGRNTRDRASGQNRSYARGLKVTGRLVAGVAGDVTIRVVGDMARKKALSLGKKKAASIIRLEQAGLLAANAGFTVADSIKIWRDNG